MTLPLPHLTALLLSYGYVGALLLGAELLRRGGKTSPDTARKIVHAGVGLWVVPTVFVFSDWRVAIVPPVTFVLTNYVIHRFRLLPALDDDPANLGTVFFPISFATLLAVFFRPGALNDEAFVAVAGILTMALGDAAAAIFGKRYGTRRYTILGHSRTMEGSMAMFLVTGDRGRRGAQHHGGLLLASGGRLRAGDGDRGGRDRGGLPLRQRQPVRAARHRGGALGAGRGERSRARGLLTGRLARVTAGQPGSNGVSLAALAHCPDPPRGRRSAPWVSIAPSPLRAALCGE